MCFETQNDKMAQRSSKRLLGAHAASWRTAAACQNFRSLG